MTTSIIKTEQNKYNEFIYGILEEELFQAGGELRKKLVDKFGVSEPHARKIIQRAAETKDIKSSKPYTFGNGQFIYLLPDHDLSIIKIKAICKKKRPPLFRLLQYMEDHNGIISFYEAMKITASPDEISSTKVNTLQDMVKVLVKLNLVYEKKDGNGVIYILIKDPMRDEFEGAVNALMASHYNKMIVDSSLTPDILRWLMASNLITTNIPIYRNKTTPSLGAKHNGLLWDAFSYTKTTGINPTVAVRASTTETQTLVVLDIVLSEDYGQLDLDGFLARIQININSVQSKKRKILPIIIYKSCSPIVLNKISKLGFLAFDIGSIFGTRIYEVLSKLKELNNVLIAEESIEHSVKKVLKIIRSAGQEDALKDLKGVLFEVLMYPFLKSLFPDASITRGKTIRLKDADGKSEGYEYDYIFNSSQPDEIVVVELKGYNSNVNISLGDKDKKASLKWFFERTLPFAKKHYKNEVQHGKRFRGIFITTANFYGDGKIYIQNLNKSSYKSIKADVAYERTDLLSLLKNHGFSTEVKIIETYYVNQDQKEFEDI